MPKSLFRNRLDPDIPPGLVFSTGNRPTQAAFRQLNTTSIQYDGLVAYWPLWEAFNTSVVDLKLGLTMPVYLTAPPIQTDSAMFGTYPLGGGNGAGGGTMRGYHLPNADIAPLDFGVNIPGSVTNWGASFWFRTTVTTAPGTDSYLMSFSSGTVGAPWSGSALSLDTGNTLAYNTNDDGLTDAAFKATGASMYDLGWHHCLFIQIPSATPNSYTATNIYYIDGVLNGSSNGCANLGGVASGNDLFFLSNDQSDPPADGALSDWRYYKNSGNFANTTTRAALAQSLFNTGTRWELLLVDG